MTWGRCQICGRRKATTRSGGLVKHYANGETCRGTGAPPLEIDDRQMEVVAAELEHAARKANLEIAALYERRANWIDPNLIRRSIDFACAAQKLRRRLKRHRDWPRRFAREMEQRGYGMAPPAYLLDRTHS